MTGPSEQGQTISAWEILIDKAKNNTGEALLNILKAAHRSDGYLLLRDHITPMQRKQLINNTMLRAEFKKIEMECKQSFDHDHTQAKMMDVDRACTNVYTVLLKLIKQINDDQTMVKDSINAIEQHLGLPISNWGIEPQEEQQAVNSENAPEVTAEPAVESATEAEPENTDEGSDNVNP